MGIRPIQPPCPRLETEVHSSQSLQLGHLSRICYESEAHIDPVSVRTPWHSEVEALSVYWNLPLNRL